MTARLSHLRLLSLFWNHFVDFYDAMLSLILGKYSDIKWRITKELANIIYTLIGC